MYALNLSKKQNMPILRSPFKIYIKMDSILEILHDTYAKHRTETSLSPFWDFERSFSANTVWNNQNRHKK